MLPKSVTNLYVPKTMAIIGTKVRIYVDWKCMV